MSSNPVESTLVCLLEYCANILLFAFQINVNIMSSVSNNDQFVMKTPPLKRQPRIRILNPDVPRDLDLMIRNLVAGEERRKKEESHNRMFDLIKKYMNIKIK